MQPMADVSRNDAKQRYELILPEGLAIAEFRPSGDALLFTHTEVPRAAQGQGAASKLISAALADARSRNLKVRPLCSFVRRYMADHPETQDLLAS